MKLETVTLSFVLLGLGLAGCAGPDLTLRNPVVSGSLDANHIVKAHGFAENQNGLPPGSMTDEAIIDTLDKSQLCVNVSLHELAALDLGQAEVKIKSDTGELKALQLAAEPPTSKTYRGLVPHTEQTGTKVTCQTDASGQTTCQSQPVMSTTMIPGPVNVFATKGRVCATNKGLVTPATKEMALKISVPTAGRGAWGQRADKSIAFRWAFQ